MARKVHGYSPIFSIRFHASDVDDGVTAPAGTWLAAVTPNPFNPRALIAFDLAESDWYELAIFDVRGDRVRVLASAEETAGRHYLAWDGRDNGGKDVAAGVYFCRLTTTKVSKTRKLTLVR